MTEGLPSFLFVPELAPIIIAVAVVSSGILASITKHLDLQKASTGFIRSFIFSSVSVVSSFSSLIEDVRNWFPWLEMLVPISFLLAIVSLIEAAYRVYRKE